MSVSAFLLTKMLGIFQILFLTLFFLSGNPLMTLSMFQGVWVVQVFFFSCPLGFALPSLMIKQFSNVLVKIGKEARLECFHGDDNYPYMYWYQHRQAAGGRRVMELIGWLQYDSANLETNFKSRFSLKGQSKGKAWLEISDTNQADSAEYFCAASRHSASTDLASSQKAGSPIPTSFILIKKNNLGGQGSVQKHRGDWAIFSVGGSYCLAGRGLTPMSLLLNY